MILYGSSLSPYVRKVLAFAGEKGIELELRPTGRRPDSRATNSSRRARSARCRRFATATTRLADSSAIIHYLEREIPRAGAHPRGPEAARQDHLVRGVRGHDPGRLRGENLLQPDRRPEIPRPGRATRRQRGRPRSTSCRRCSIISRASCPTCEGYLVGDRLTLADIAVASPFANFRHTNTRIDPERYPRTCRLRRSNPRAAELRAVDRAGNGNPREVRGIRKRRAPAGTRRLAGRELA